ncbi:MAG: pyridoxamine 5'-phosphate oxidase family protein [Acidobacteria bacterium]|nr:pyridoxamine 5'-phosphate oxidase family protein [Acidobacteriota bacterium]
MNKSQEPKTHRQDSVLCESIISKCPVCRLGMMDGNQPYVIPVNFGYKDRTVYIHTGIEGKKLNVLSHNPNVCVEFDTGHELVRGAVSCKWTMHGESVVAEGTAELLKTAAEKRQGLKTIMAHYGGNGNDIPDNALDTVAIIRIKLTNITTRTV